MVVDLGIEETIKQIVADAEDIVIEATIEAGKRTQRNIETYAKAYMSLYYGEYIPIRYKRTKHLVNAIVPYLSPSVHRGKFINIKAGIIYDSNQLNYKENGRDKPDSGWVLNNFLQGIHTRYPLNDIKGHNQLELMNQVLNKELDKASDYIADTFLKGVVSRILKK